MKFSKKKIVWESAGCDGDCGDMVESDGKCGTVPYSDSEHGTVLDGASEHDMDNMAL